MLTTKSHRRNQYVYNARAINQSMNAKEHRKGEIYIDSIVIIIHNSPFPIPYDLQRSRKIKQSTSRFAYQTLASVV